MALTTEQRNKFRIELLKAGQATRGLTDDEIERAAAALGSDDIPPDVSPHAPFAPRGEGQPSDDDEAPSVDILDLPETGDDGASDDDDGADGADGDAPSDGADDSAGEGDDDDGDDGDAPSDSGDGDDGDDDERDASDDSSGDADDDGDDGDDDDDDGAERERKEREDEAKRDRAEDSDTMAEIIRKIANEEIDGRDLDERLNAIRKLAREALRAAANAGSGSGSNGRVVIVKRPKASKAIEGAHPIFEEVMRSLSVGLHPLLVGPAGSGKSHMAKQAAEALDLPFYSTGAVHQKYELTGYTDAYSKYAATLLYEVVKNGGVFLFDEIDASIAAALVAFNQLLSNGECSWPNGEMVTCHENAYFIAAANTIGLGANRTYVGRTPLDGATLDRFDRIHVAYDEAMETKLTHAAYAKFGGAHPQKVDMWLGMVRKLRAFAENQNWPIVVSPRMSDKGARLLAAGANSERLHNMLYMDLSTDQRRQFEASH